MLKLPNIATAPITNIPTIIFSILFTLYLKQQQFTQHSGSANEYSLWIMAQATVTDRCCPYITKTAKVCLPLSDLSGELDRSIVGGLLQSFIYV